ncbi:MAG: hypothetical protein Q8O19_07940 [Rectinemataceae bacterium]|nr:hypothetical protein [Rectinemataceae bacterium]
MTFGEIFRGGLNDYVYPLANHISAEHLFSLISVYILLLTPILVVVRASYIKDSAVLRRVKLVAGIRDMGAEVASLQNNLKSLETNLRSKEGDRSILQQQLVKALVEEDRKVKENLLGAEASANSDILQLRKKISDLAQSEQTQLNSLSTRLNSEINHLQIVNNNLDSRMRNEWSAELIRLQDAHVQSALRNHSISSASISGIGEKLTSRLSRAGIATAADVSFSRVTSLDGIGSQKGHTLSAWRSRIEQLAKSTQPSSLPSHVENQIRSKYTSQASTHQSRIATLRKQLVDESSALRYRINQEKSLVEDQIRSKQSALKSTQQTIIQEGEKSKASLTRQFSSKSSDLERNLAKMRQEVQQVRQKLGQKTYLLDNSKRKLTGYSQINLIGFLRHKI